MKSKSCGLGASHSQGCRAYFNLDRDLYCFFLLKLTLNRQPNGVCVCVCPPSMAAGLQSGVCVYYIGAKLGKPQQHSCNSSQHHPSQEETGPEWKSKIFFKEERTYSVVESQPPIQSPHILHPLSTSLLFPSLFRFLSCATLPCFVPGEAALCLDPRHHVCA